MYWKNQMREMIEKHGMTMKDLAQAIDINYQTFYKAVRRNKDIKMELLQRMADFFNVPIQFFTDPNYVAESRGVYMRALNESERLALVEKKVNELESKFEALRQSVQKYDL